MKLQLFVLAVAMFLASEAMEMPPFVKTAMDECQNEFGLTKDDLKNPAGLPADKKCFHKCVGMKIGYMDSNGKIQLDSFKKMHAADMPAAMLAKLEKCSKTILPDPCDTAENHGMCIHKD